jgi:hypothetical protein
MNRKCIRQKTDTFHIVNSLDFVEMKIKIVKVDIMGTRQLRAPTAIDTDETDLTESSIATVYWKREVDNGYKAAIDLHILMLPGTRQGRVCMTLPDSTL